eukprot:614421-Prymnesium_polylepis.2
MTVASAHVGGGGKFCAVTVLWANAGGWCNCCEGCRTRAELNPNLNANSHSLPSAAISHMLQRTANGSYGSISAKFGIANRSA